MFFLSLSFCLFHFIYSLVVVVEDFFSFLTFYAGNPLLLSLGRSLLSHSLLSPFLPMSTLMTIASTAPIYERQVRIPIFRLFSFQVVTVFSLSGYVKMEDAGMEETDIPLSFFACQVTVNSQFVSVSLHRLHRTRTHTHTKGGNLEYGHTDTEIRAKRDQSGRKTGIIYRLSIHQLVPPFSLHNIFID